MLLSFRKNVIPREICCRAFNALEKEAQKKEKAVNIFDNTIKEYVNKVIDREINKG